MDIIGIQGISREQLRQEVSEGGRFVVFRFCISVVILTFRRSTGIYYIRPGENAVVKSLPWTLMTLLLGWWGIPWGPIYSVNCLYKNLSGGTDVTGPVKDALQLNSPPPMPVAPPPLPG